MRLVRFAVVPVLALALGGCWSQPGSSPLDLAASTPAEQPVVGQPVAEWGGSAPDDGAGAPEPARLVATRGGDIMVQSPEEMAARRRQLALLRRETDPKNFAVGMRLPPPAKPMTAGAAVPNSALQ